jgi:hypothetical protein
LRVTATQRALGRTEHSAGSACSVAQDLPTTGGGTTKDREPALPLRPGQRPTSHPPRLGWERRARAGDMQSGLMVQDGVFHFMH